MDPIVAHLGAHEFRALFLERLGWDRAHGLTAATADGLEFWFDTIAHKRGFRVFHCRADRYTMLNRSRLRLLQRQLLRVAHEHIVIFSCDEPRKQVWEWAVHLPGGRRVRHREHPFFSSNPPEDLIARLGILRFTLAEEEKVTLLDALDRVRKALDLDATLDLFAKRPWYAERSDRLAIAMAGGGDAAFHRFVEFHLPLAQWGAKKWGRFFSYHEDEDAEQIAAIGLMQAARRFDRNRGVQFATYASYWIRQACQRFGPDVGRLIRVPGCAARRCRDLRRRLKQLDADHDATIDLLREAANSHPKVWRALRRYNLATNVASLSDRAAPEFREARQLPYERDSFVFAVDIDTARLVRKAVDALDPKDAMLIRLRYGIDCEPQTLKQIGVKFRLTRERIRQRQVEIERRLQADLAHRLEIQPLTQPTQHTSCNAISDSDLFTRTQERLLAIIEQHPSGLPAEVLTYECRLTARERKAALRALVGADKIRQIGSGRNTFYCPLSLSQRSVADQADPLSDPRSELVTDGT
jgi:RNA polymerase primary sigma factor